MQARGLVAATDALPADVDVASRSEQLEYRLHDADLRFDPGHDDLPAAGREAGEHVVERREECRLAPWGEPRPRR